MSSPYETSRSRRRGVWSHWVPLAVTITIATIGVAAWAWSQRKNDEEENDAAQIDYDYETVDYGDNPAYGTGRDLRQSAARPALPNVDGTYGGVGEVHPETSGSAAGWGSHVSGALRRTPSPQQFLSNAGKTVAAGVAGVGAAVGSALAAIREEDKTAYADHETWSEEAEARKEKPSPRPSPRPTPSPRPSPSPIMASPKMSPPKPVPPKFASPKVSSPAPRSAAQNRKTIVLVVSADINVDDFEEIESQEIASILSHIPRNIDFAKIKLFVLIYAPGIKDAGIETIAQIASEETKSPPLSASNPANSAFNAAFSQALALVEKETMVMPFTTAGGYVHILRHLEPDVLYLQASLAGEDGNLVTQIQSWLRHDVILVVGADGGHGGLADSESEAEHNDSVQRVEKSEPWWQKEERVGRGRGVIVVDSLRVGDDWSRRVLGNE